ncbi:MAG TPA: hypothetical protein VE134_04620 [Methanomicrobiales archaeon]|nr:hypothetical protein [Methanomicrobiales archaeon]
MQRSAGQNLPKFWQRLQNLSPFRFRLGEDDRDREYRRRRQMRV